MVSKLAVLALVAAEELVGAGTLALSWSDCGTSSTHAKVTSLTPKTLTLGEETKILGTGALDEDVADGTYTIDVKASIITKHFNGKIGEKATFDLPAGLGSLTWDGLSLPLAKGPSVQVPVDVKLSGSIPTSLAKATITIKATEANGHDLLCLTVNTAPATELEAAATCTSGAGPCLVPSTGFCDKYVCAEGSWDDCKKYTNVCACKTVYNDGSADQGKPACCGNGCPTHRSLEVLI